MADFKLDHVVIRTPDRDGLVRLLAAEAGLAALRGYAAGDELHSTGVRFANGPFLDVFAAPAAGTALILQGPVDAAERLAAVQGWGVRYDRRESRPAEHPAFPWSMALFRRGQGLLTHVSVIEYAPEPEAWADPDFSGALYRPELADGAAARLARVWLDCEDLVRAERDLAMLGYGATGEAGSAFWPHRGRRLSGPAAELVLFEGPDGVARLDIATGQGRPREIVLPGAPRLVFDEDA